MNAAFGDASLTVAVGVVSGVLGLAIGSFLNVVIWRVPRGESVVSPPSSCPRCGTGIRGRDNIPVLSWLFLRARCRHCGERISVRYPIVELVTAVLFLVVGLRFGTSISGVLSLPALLFFTAIAVALAIIDLDTHRLPNAIVLPAYPIAVVLLTVAVAASGDWFALLRAGLAAIALFAFYFLLMLIYPRGMGFGDVKLAGVIGLYLGYVGWGAVLSGAFAAFLLGGVYAIVLIVTRRATRKSGIPFGPWMLGGAFIGVLFGNQIATAYLSVVGLD